MRRHSLRLSPEAVAVLAVAVALTSSAASAADGEAAARRWPFVRRVGRELRTGDRVHRAVGASNYYLMYKSTASVDNVLNAAVAAGFNTIRLWGSLDIGNQDGSNSIRGKAEGVYFHYWNGTAPAFNDGANGLEHLDYVIFRAGQLGLRLIIPFVNNWNDFGGMDQYVRWRGGQYHDDFYTDPVVRTWYKEWIAHLLNRVNVFNGVAYKDDPTIMTWELGNEPRCKSGGVYPSSGSCTTQTLIAWADDASAFVKTVDANHLVSVGDEGFYCVLGSTDWTENCGEGIDTLALANLSNVDVMSFHLYPESWGKDAAWGTEWIKRHVRDSHRIRERALLGEFGLRDKAARNPAYKKWTDTALVNAGFGALYWMIADRLDDGSYYPDYDGFTVYCPSPVCTTITNFAAMMQGGPYVFPPVADDDLAETPFETPVTLHAAANDVAYWNRVVPGTVDLDPSTPGVDTELTSAAGSFVSQGDGDVLFTPAAGFSGPATASYVVRDLLRKRSNVARIAVTVKPDPAAAIRLYSFETGTEGWGSAAWQTNAGTVAQSTYFASDGAHSLEVTAADGGWFGLALPSAVSLVPKTHLKFEVQTLAAGTSQNAAVQLGDSWQWCQGPWGWINPGTTTTVDIDLTALDCGISDVSQLHALYVWFSGGGVFYLDAVRAE